MGEDHEHRDDAQRFDAGIPAPPPPFEILECASALCLALTRLSFSTSCFSLIILCIGHNPEN